MIGAEELKNIREAMQMVSEGKTLEKKTPSTPSWIPESIDDKNTFVQCVKEAYESGAKTFEYSDITYTVEFVKEDRTVSVKPGLYGKTNVLVGSRVIKSFTETRKARVYSAYLQEHVKNMQKPAFDMQLVKSVTSK